MQTAFRIHPQILFVIPFAQRQFEKCDIRTARSISEDRSTVRNFLLNAAGRLERQGNYFDNLQHLPLTAKQIES
jgi:hypothetical protein